MSAHGWAQLAAVVGVLAVVVPLLGWYLAAVFGSGTAPGDRFFGPIERTLFRLAGVDSESGQHWTVYAR